MQHFQGPPSVNFIPFDGPTPPASMLLSHPTRGYFILICRFFSTSTSNRIDGYVQRSMDGDYRKSRATPFPPMALWLFCPLLFYPLLSWALSSSKIRLFIFQLALCSALLRLVLFSRRPLPWALLWCFHKIVGCLEISASPKMLGASSLASAMFSMAPLVPVRAVSSSKTSLTEPVMRGLAVTRL